MSLKAKILDRTGLGDMKNRPKIHRSDEVVKFVLFMMRELGVSNVPALKTLKKKKFGTCSWENLITKGASKENSPVFIIKPSEILKLAIANPEISKRLIRSPDCSDVISHLSNAEKWKKDIDFISETHDKPVVTMPINLFLDDTSTHKSRRWMAFHCIQMQLSGLPLDIRHQQGNIQFLGASEKVDIMDVAKVVVKDIKDLQLNGIESYDVAYNRPCIVKSCIDNIVADFNILSLCCNHLGAAAIKYCPRCNADADHYMTLGQKRTPQETQRQVDRINTRSKEIDKRKLRKKTGIKENENVFWDFIDPHRDIPVGLLHLISLGVAKHLVKYITDRSSENIITKMSHHLSSVYPGSQFKDFYKYLDSRQGKDFKQYIQKKLNQTSFSHSDIDTLREDIRLYHQMINEHAPELKKKAKTHLLLHVIEDIQRHGPPIAYEEDSFEKNHGVIRNLLFLQNQKARSRDTSVEFAKQLLCYHVLSGGYFESGLEWTQASRTVTEMGESKQILKFLGLNSKVAQQKTPGLISMIERKANKLPFYRSFSEDLTLQLLLLPFLQDTNVDCRYVVGSAVNAKSGELVHVGEWIKYIGVESQEYYGIFLKGIILTPHRGAKKQLATIIKSTSLSEKILGCCQFSKSNDMTIIPTQNIIEKAPILHDCYKGKCRIVSRLHTERIEQENVTKEMMHLKHNVQHNVYFLNNFKF